MDDYLSYVYEKICAALEKCNEFISDGELRATFAHPRISMWQDMVHTATNLQSRVRAVVDLLLDKHDSGGRNALVWLLRVLSGHYHSDDAMHLELLDLAFELQTALGPSKPTIPETDKNSVIFQQSPDMTSPNTFLTFTINRTGLELRIHW